MFPAKERFRCGGHEYVLLQKDDSPRIVELPQLDEELERGAKRYPQAEDRLEKDWVLVPFEHFRELEREGRIEKCMSEELEGLGKRGM